MQGTREVINLNSEPSSPEDGGTFRRSMQIDNKGLVGDAVGNVSNFSRSEISKLIYFADEHKPIQPRCSPRSVRPYYPLFHLRVSSGCAVVEVYS